MSVFFMFGKYSPDSIEKISPERTQEVRDLIERFEGSVKDIYSLLGSHDIVIIADFSKNQDAMKASLALTRMTKISFSTVPAITVDEFDRMVSEA